MNVSEKIKQVRESKAISPLKLSQLSGVPLTNVLNIEKNMTLNPDPNDIARICSALGISLNPLIPNTPTNKISDHSDEVVSLKLQNEILQGKLNTLREFTDLLMSKLF